MQSNNNPMTFPPQSALAMLDHFADPVLAFDVGTLRVTHLNQIAQETAAASRANGVVLNDLASWLGLTREETQSRFGAHVLSGPRVDRLDVSHFNAHFDVCLQRPPNSGFSDQIVAIFHDITRRHESERLKKELVSTVSHELRSPLTAIKGAMGLVLAGSAGAIPRRAHEMIQIAHRNSDRLILIINDILDLDKIADGAMVFDNAEVNLNDVIETAAEAIAGFSQRFDVGVTVVSDCPDAVSFVDPNRMVQVLVNLLSNAIKFSPTGGNVTISLSFHDGFNRISVADTGDGIPLADQELVFQRFVQFGQKNQAATGGTGLGLSIVQAIVEKQGSQISFNSVFGSGTTFFVDVPVYEDMQYDTQKFIGFSS